MVAPARSPGFNGEVKAYVSYRATEDPRVG